MITENTYLLLLFLPLLGFLAVAAFNAVTGPYLKNRFDYTGTPKVSILIPARNEERNILRSIESACGQSYPNFEVIVLDDDSEDKTAEIAREAQKQYPSLKLIEGAEVPPGWTGKSWACSRLAREAEGDILVFTDADNWYHQMALRNTVGRMQNYGLDMLSAFPDQVTGTFFERIIVPVIDMIVYSFLPLWAVYISKKPSIAAANGQWIAVSREAYFEAGGHESVKDKIVEDIEMNRRFKRLGFKTMTCAGTDIVYGRMYYGFREIWSGFTKNAFGLAGHNTFILFLAILTLSAVSILPYVMVFFSGSLVWIMLIAMNVLWRLILSAAFNNNILSVIFHPIALIIFFAISINSFIDTKSGTIKWKGREINLR